MIIDPPLSRLRERGIRISSQFPPRTSSASSMTMRAQPLLEHHHHPHHHAVIAGVTAVL